MNGRVVAVAALAVLLSGCIVAIEASPKLFEVASTDGPIRLDFITAETIDVGTYRVSGVTNVDIEAISSGRCASGSPGRLLRMEIVDLETHQVVHDRDLGENPACHGDRFLWNGQELVQLEEGESWPDDVYTCVVDCYIPPPSSPPPGQP